ncbi:MAG TPA: hypothetical protein VMU99_05535 [Acidimicrobiales bacterium]|nr:hypothetical protein [Acidimicrobiales bacterium]
MSTSAEGSGGGELDHRAEWGFVAVSEHRWPASLAVAVAIVLQVILPDRVITGMGPRWLIPLLEGALATALLVANPKRVSSETRYLRAAAIALIVLINAANVVSLGELIHALVSHVSSPTTGRALVTASVPIWLTNVLVFGLWYWELDRGGPGARLGADRREPDFLFPQMVAVGATRDTWSPKFLDYLYTSFTNATAFSPTDTMPLTAWAKLLMMVQSFASFLTVAIVISRAVNILQ